MLQVSDFNLAKILGPAGSSSTSAGGPANPQWLVSGGAGGQWGLHTFLMARSRLSEACMPPVRERHNASHQRPTGRTPLASPAQAPEVVQGDKASAASDVFSFGMVLLELLTWRLPWRDTPVWEVGCPCQTADP